jgi:hypothetical protein
LQGAIQGIIDEAKEQAKDSDGDDDESVTSEEENVHPPNLAEQAATGSES